MSDGAGDAPAFDAVVPSLPGFGFSGPTRQRGWGVRRHARVMAELLRRLGYAHYLVQGGDRGSVIVPEIPRIAPDHVIGIHLNAAVGATVVDWTSPDPTAGLADEDWLTRTAASAGRLHREGGDAFYGGERTDHPVAVAVFPGDGAIRSLAERSLSVVRWTEYDRGGHFASLQAPDLLVADVRAFCQNLRGADVELQTSPR